MRMGKQTESNSLASNAAVQLEGAPLVEVALFYQN